MPFRDVSPKRREDVAEQQMRFGKNKVEKYVKLLTLELLPELCQVMWLLRVTETILFVAINSLENAPGIETLIIRCLMIHTATLGMSLTLQTSGSPSVKWGG